MQLNMAYTAKIDEVCSLILKNPHEDYTITRLARLSGLNATFLAKEFKQMFGIEISTFILSNRMFHARRLLQSDKSIKEIYALLGYASVASFSKSFKRFHGFPPAQYRKKK